MSNFPNTRCWEIVNILLNTAEPITINQIAKKLSVSNRTVRNDLKEIEAYFESNNFGRIVKKPRIGIWLEANQEKRLLIRNSINKSKGYIHPFSSEDRQLYIIKRLLLSDSSITTQLLADEIYVSRVTVYKDLEEVEKWLKKYNLRLKRRQNYGIEVVGNENDWRKAAADLLILLKNDEEIKSLLSNENDIQTDQRMGYKDYLYVKELFPDIEIRKIEEILSEAENKMDVLLTDEAFAGLLVHIAICIQRIKQKKDIKMCSKELNNIKNHIEYEIASWIANRIEQEFNINLPEPEIGYISLHILGAKIQENFHSLEVKEILNNVDSNILEFTKEIVALIGNILSVDFSRDKKLLAGLVLHLRPAINRLKYGLSLRNPLLEEIKNKYPSIFGAAWATSVLFEKFFGVKVTEEEIGYLAIHIGAALERLNSKTRAIIVCSSGIGTAQLVAVRLEREIRGLEIVGITSVHDINKVKSTDFDIIVSTIPLKYISKPTIQISVFVTENDVNRVKEYIKNIENTRKFDKNSLEIIEANIFNKDLICPQIKAKNKDDVIRELVKLLEEGKYVDECYINTVIEREKITSTAVGKGVAIPHGQEKLVKIPTIAVATLENPIDWSGEKVDIVFLLALKFETGNEIRKFFKKFYSMFDNVKILNSIREKKTSEEIYNILIGKGDGYE
jgi:transcriptional antiterminator/mannitol/fructose-specific phosphotransferase system IIA component (Ntr-type)